MGRSRIRECQVDRARSFAALRGLSDEALLYLHEVFERKRQGAGPTYEELLADLKTRFGFEWNDSSLSRYYLFWLHRLREENEILQLLRRIIRTLDTEVGDGRAGCGAADRDPRPLAALGRK